MKRKYYNNGIKNIRIPEDQTPPDGFVPGQLRNKLSEDKKKHFKESRQKTCLEKYGDSNYNNSSKRKKTKLERFGSETYNNSEKHAQTCLERYGVDSYSKTIEYANKCKQTFLERYGVEFVGQLQVTKDACLTDEAKRRSHDTKKKNGTFNTSHPEDMFYEYLKLYYDEDDIIRQYRDDRYPFNCDFYIKSEDLFIECNYSWTHGGHEYDPNNQDDVEKLELWKSKNSDYYNQAIYTWTNLDVRKKKFAIENNLNYITLYDYNK